MRGFYSAEAHPLYQLGGTPLSDIFISYAKADRNEALKLSAYLESLGYGVWWDRGLQSGDEFRDVIIAAGALHSERFNRLVAENVVPVVGLRSADAFQGLFSIIG